MSAAAIKVRFRPASDVVSAQGSCNDDWNAVLARIFEKSHRPDACLTSNLCSRGMRRRALTAA